MAKINTRYVCSACGGDSPQWQGQCPACGDWNTLTALRGVTADTVSAQSHVARRSGAIALQGLASPSSAGPPRLASGFAELDRVLGGGWVPGGVALIGGDPGIGKSTLLLQVAAQVAGQAPVWYVSGEESVEQLRLRARRLGLLGQGSLERLTLLCDHDLDAALAEAAKAPPALMIVDSIQTVETAAGQGAAGGVTQLRECASQIVRFAKSSGTTVVMIGHVTKDGALAGPRVLEHLVDVVLYFASDSGSRYRLVRATKNRYGAIAETAFFVMQAEGLREVRNPSAIFLARSTEAAAGSIVLVSWEGGRPLLVEVQALVDPTRFANPRRVADGVDSNRISMLLAVLHRHGGYSLADHDVFANVVGGLTLRDTGSDLPLLLAMASSFRDRVLPADLCAFGEVGLSGELRPVAYGEERLREAAKQGFRRALVPAANAPRQAIEGLTVLPVARISEALRAVL
jgi:DNA repair protein RadA/Sms